MPGKSQKALLKEYNQQRLAEFKYSKTFKDSKQMQLPAPSLMPGYAASDRLDTYRKQVISLSKDHSIKFISKNNQAKSFIWQTNAKKIHEASRWGIISTESLTSKTIATLGEYRLLAHERIANGFISNTHYSKIALLDFYQSRFEKLQALESLVNTDVSLNLIDKAFNDYITQLDSLENNLTQQFAHTLLSKKLNIVDTLTADIAEEKKRANAYRKNIKQYNSLKAFRRAAGNDSILEFIKRQMITSLHEMQGLNQDLSFSRHRTILAATRGEMNSCIEDAKKAIEDFQPDLRNAVLSEHHGIYADKDELVSYDFSRDHLAPKNERRTLLAISFIEGCDQIEKNNAVYLRKNISTDEQQISPTLAKLDVAAATNWKTYRDTKDFFQRLGHGFIRIVKSFVVETRPWIGDPWHNGFKLFAHELQQYAKPVEPLWKKPYHLIAIIGRNIKDIFSGIKEVATSLAIDLPNFITQDWESSKAFNWSKEKKEIENTITQIKADEDKKLDLLINEINKSMNNKFQNSSQSIPFFSRHSIHPASDNIHVAANRYHLTPGEQNDILSAVAHGLNGFADVISHNIYAKNPLPAVVFTLAGLSCGASILFPEAIKLLNPQLLPLVDAFNKMGNALGASPIAKAGSAAMSSANLSAMGVEALLDGPHSMLANALDELSNDPLTAATCFAAAYATGWVLTNGIGPLQLPELQEFLKEEMGAVPQFSYPLVGGKLAILLAEAFATHKDTKLKNIDINALQNLQQTLNISPAQGQQIKTMIDQLALAKWLFEHKDKLTQLKSRHKFNIERRINEIFPFETAQSLNKLIHPEKPRSIAYQLIVIPLSYVPALLRLIVSPFLGLAAVINGNQHPAAPMQSSALKLYHKSLRDLSRMIVFSKSVAHLTYKVISTPIKLVVNLSHMIIGRITGSFGINSGHRIYQIMAKTSIAIYTIREFFNPVRALKKEQFAHPNHSLMQIENSHSKLIKILGRNQKSSPADSPDNYLTSKEDFNEQPAQSKSTPAMNSTPNQRRYTM